jgi:hypothetical protein
MATRRSARAPRALPAALSSPPYSLTGKPSVSYWVHPFAWLDALTVSLSAIYYANLPARPRLRCFRKRHAMVPPYLNTTKTTRSVAGRRSKRPSRLVVRMHWRAPIGPNPTHRRRRNKGDDPHPRGCDRHPKAVTHILGTQQPSPTHPPAQLLNCSVCVMLPHTPAPLTVLPHSPSMSSARFSQGRWQFW